MIIFLLTIIAVCLVLLVISLGLLWRKIDVYLTWNTKYEGAEYQTTVTTPKFKRPSLPARKTEQHGRSIKPMDDLVDLADMDIEDAMNIVEAAGNGS